MFKNFKSSSMVIVFFMLMGLVPVMPISADIGTAYTLLNPGFESGITSWSSFGGTFASVTSPVQSGTKAASLTTSSTSTAASVWQTIVVGGSGPGFGTEMEADAWVYVDPADDFTLGTDYLQVNSYNGTTNTPIAQFAIGSGFPKGQWVLVKTAANINGGKLLSDATTVTVAFQHNSRGKITFDNISMGRVNTAVPVTGEYSLPNNSFENSQTTLTSWSTFGNTSVFTGDGYYGKQSAKFINTAGTNTSIWQVIPLGSGTNDPKVGGKVEAGVWAYFNSDVNLSSGAFFIQVESVIPNNPNVLLAKSAVISASTPKNTWVYVETAPVGAGAVVSGSASIVVSIQSTMTGTIYSDFAQVGNLGVINGNPVKYAVAVYQPWFGNATDGSNSGMGWGNWAWTGGPCGTTCYNHNPNTILGNGQRDIASVFYPMVGAYNSLDDNLLSYQMDMAKAELVDAFMVNDYGQVIKPSFRQVEEKMLNLAEQKDMKFSVQYEAKVNLNGWVSYPANATRQDRINGIQNDLKWMLDHWAPRKAFLKYNGQAVISVFGAYLLSDAEWSGIINNLKNMGYKFLVMGDNGAALTDTTINPATFYNSFQSNYAWHFSDSTLNPANNPTYTTGYNFAYTNGHDGTKRWADATPNRFGVGVVWPGFNDTGVGSWGSGNIRLGDYMNGLMYDAATKAANDVGMNWVMIATWNDWNEATIIEPSVQNGYKYAIKTQNFLEQFKGVPAQDDNQMQTITEAYKANPNVIHYN